MKTRPCNEDPRLTPREDLVGELYDEEDWNCWSESARDKKIKLSTFSQDGMIAIGDGHTWFFLVPEQAVDLANQLMALAQDLRVEENV